MCLKHGGLYPATLLADVDVARVTKSSHGFEHVCGDSLFSKGATIIRFICCHMCMLPYLHASITGNTIQLWASGAAAAYPCSGGSCQGFLGLCHLLFPLALCLFASGYVDNSLT